MIIGLMNLRKVAIISDVVMDVGGAEKVLEVFLEMFPESDLHTLLVTDKARERIRKKFPKVKIVTSCFQKIVDYKIDLKYLSLIKTFSWIYWEMLDLRKYDLVISSSHSFGSKAVRGGKRHVSYVHTPPRYLYDEFNEMSLIKRWPFKLVCWPLLSFLRMIDKKGASRPDVLVANSKNVQFRIKKYYGRDSVVVYPAVEVKSKVKNKKLKVKKEYYVCLSRLVKQKGIELAVRTCISHGLRLVVVGDGPEKENLRKIAGDQISFKDNCSDKEKFILMQKAKALIYPSIEEDFGIVPVEALSVGTPVVGYNSGGVKEVIISGKNGVLFDDFSERSLYKAILKLDKLKITKSDCIDSVERFSRERFVIQIKNIINDK